MNLPKLRSVSLRNPRVLVAVGLVVVCIVTAVLWHTNIIVARQDELAELKAKHAQKQNELNKIILNKPRRNQLRQEVVRLEGKLDSLRSKFPDEKKVPKLIRDITRVARASGIRTTRFYPLADSTKEYYVENRDSVTVVGGYHELATFFGYLANFDLIINLGNMSIKTNPNIGVSMAKAKDHGGTVKSVEASFMMTTFSSKK